MLAMQEPVGCSLCGAVPGNGGASLSAAAQRSLCSATGVGMRGAGLRPSGTSRKQRQRLLPRKLPKVRPACTFRPRPGGICNVKHILDSEVGSCRLSATGEACEADGKRSMCVEWRMLAPAQPSAAADAPYVAVGVLSSAVGERYARRRGVVRETWLRFDNVGKSVLVRFVLRCGGLATNHSVWREASTHGDVLCTEVSAARHRKVGPTLALYVWMQHNLPLDTSPSRCGCNTIYLSIQTRLGVDATRSLDATGAVLREPAPRQRAAVRWMPHRRAAPWMRCGCDLRMQHSLGTDTARSWCGCNTV